MARKKRITIRLSDNEYKAIEEKSQSSFLSISEFSRKALLNKKIVAVDGIHELTNELRKIGNNLNQLTRLANQNRLEVLNLAELKEGISEIWQLLNSLTRKVR